MAFVTCMLPLTMPTVSVAVSETSRPNASRISPPGRSTPGGDPSPDPGEPKPGGEPSPDPGDPLAYPGDPPPPPPPPMLGGEL